MELNEIRNIVIANSSAIQTINQRVTALEKANDCITGVQMALERLTMESKYLGEKLDDVKKSIDKINVENQKQHEELQNRLSDIESKPGKRWETIVGQIIAIAIAAALGYFLGK